MTAPVELVEFGVRWRWDATVSQALGPFCPEHGHRLSYQASFSGQIKTHGFDGEQLGASGWLVCPVDGWTFAVPTMSLMPFGLTVGHLRAHAGERLRAMVTL